MHQWGQGTNKGLEAGHEQEWWELLRNEVGSLEMAVGEGHCEPPKAGGHLKRRI